MNNEHAIYGKTTRNFRIRISVKLVNKKKRLITMDIKTKLYVAQKI